MEITDLSFNGMVAYLTVVIAKVTDPRKASKGTKYSLKDAMLGAFAAFFLQNESFLEYQRQLNSRCGRDNAQSLFGLEKIPTSEFSLIFELAITGAKPLLNRLSGFSVSLATFRIWNCWDSGQGIDKNRKKCRLRG